MVSGIKTMYLFRILPEQKTATLALGQGTQGGEIPAVKMCIRDSSQTRYDSYCAMYAEVKDVKDWQRPKV